VGRPKHVRDPCIVEDGDVEPAFLQVEELPDTAAVRVALGLALGVGGGQVRASFA
jgi:hypothetical protein